MATARVPLLDLTGHLPESYAPPSVALDAATATTKAGEALASRNAAGQSETNAGLAKVAAEAARNLAQGYRDAASGHAATATTKAGEALASANNAAATLASAAKSADLGLAFGLDGVVESASPTITVIGSIAGVAYGTLANGTIGLWRSTDDGATWQQVSTVRAYGIAAMGDGEVIANDTGQLRKSTGWAADPTTATFAVVATGTGTAGFIQSGLDAYSTLVIAAEYAASPNRADSRYVKLSTDSGATFTNVLDLNVLYPGQESATHWHAVCIDQWHTGANPRLWAAHGDGPRGVYYSDDLGANWTLYVSDWQPMTMIATPNGIVCATDSYTPDGIWLIPRNLGAKVALHIIREPFWAGTMLGLGSSTARDPRDPSRVIVTFRADQHTEFTYGNPGRIFVSDGYRASEVYATAHTATVGTTNSVNWESPPAVTSSGKLLATYTVEGARYTVAGQLKSIAPTHQVADPGNVLTGTAAGRSDIAIGSRTTASRQSVVIGSAAGQLFAPATDSGGVAVGEEASIRNLAVAVGYKAVATSHGAAVGQTATTGDDGVAVGSASTAGSLGTTVGRAASCSNESVAVGSYAAASGATSVALGRQSVASNTSGVAIGKGTSSTGAAAIAVGLRASATHTYAVAIGVDAVSSADSQVTFGVKHIELGELADPAAPAANKARLYVRDNGAGKTQLCVRFNTGAVQVIATEP